MRPDPTDSIKQLHAQICKIPALNDQTVQNHLEDIDITVSLIIDQFHEQKKIILEHFDQWIMPIAQDFLDGLCCDVEKLKIQLDQKIGNIDRLSVAEWEIEAKHWVQWYSKWSDRQRLINKILEAVADRTAYLINKDIQMIQDYQTQSLSHLGHHSDAFRSLEERLSHAIEEPLKQLMSLRTQAKENSSLQQASEWVANLQERRESYFDQLLMKIDHVMKDVVHVDEVEDLGAFVEVEGEIIFMEQELHHINEDLLHIHLMEDCDKQFLLARLQGLSEHALDVERYCLPFSLQLRMEELKAKIVTAIERLSN